MTKSMIQTLLECKTLEGDSPVEEIDMLFLNVKTLRSFYVKINLRIYFFERVGRLRLGV